MCDTGILGTALEFEVLYWNLPRGTEENQNFRQEVIE
jgi:hypothetical protein